MKILFSLIALFACALLVRAQADLSQNPALDKKISLEIPISSLSDFARQLREKGGITVIVTANIADRKITLLVKDKTIRYVMEQVAKLYDAQWQLDQRTYRLEVPNKITLLEQDLIKKEEDAKKAYVEAALKRLVGVIQNYSLSELEEESRKLYEDLDKLRKESSPEAKAKYNEVYEKLRTVGQNLNSYPLGYIIYKSGPNGIANLMSGNTLYASTSPSDGMLLLPKEFIRERPLPGTPDGSPVKRNETTVVVAKYFPLKGVLQLQNHVVMPGGGAKANASITKPAGEIDAEFKDHAFRKLASEWATPFKSPEIQPTLKTPLDLKSAIPYSGSQSHNRRLRLCDHLLWLCKATGITILAEPSRLAQEFNAPIQAADIRSWLSVFTSENDTAFKGYVRVEPDCLFFREQAFWRQRLKEVPERLYAPMEAKIAHEKKLTVDDYGKFAAQLNDRQLASFEERWAICTTFDCSPLADAPLALRFWGALTPIQKRQAKTPDGIPANALGAAQAQYWAIIRESLWSNIIMDARMRNAMIRGGDPELSKAMRFFYAEDKMVSLQLASYYRADGSLSRFIDFEREDIKGSAFQFGTVEKKEVEFPCSFNR